MIEEYFVTMLAAMLKPQALATSFVVVPSKHFFQKSGKKHCLVTTATTTFQVVEEEGRRHCDGSIQRLTIVQPDDWHLHLRDGEGLTTVAPLSAGVFRRAIIMPNLKPPMTNLSAALAYRDRIMKALPSNVEFQPLMTLYLTDVTSRKDIKDASESGLVKAVKLYPTGATTNSQAGVTNLFGKCMPVLEEMVEQGLPLLVHGEVTEQTVDIFDREKVFIETVLTPLKQKLLKLKIVMEHITTEDAVVFVASNTDVTPQHLLMNRNALFQGGLQPHNYCLPVLKCETHRVIISGSKRGSWKGANCLKCDHFNEYENLCGRALVAAVTSGSQSFFLGTDSASHERHAKEASCGCAGIFSAPIALLLYAEAFEQEKIVVTAVNVRITGSNLAGSENDIMFCTANRYFQAGALDKLEGFTSLNGPDFSGLPRNSKTTTLIRKSWHVPTEYGFGPGAVVPMWAGQALNWNIE